MYLANDILTFWTTVTQLLQNVSQVTVVTHKQERQIGIKQMGNVTLLLRLT